MCPCPLEPSTRSSRCPVSCRKSSSSTLLTHSHASISPALRAERGLPENLIRLCVGIEDPRDLLDDLETALIASGAIVPRNDDALLSHDKLDSLYASSPADWGTERARFFKRPFDQDLAEGVSKGLTLGGEAATAKVKPKTLDNDIVVSAPGKVILFGEHAVVHGVVGDEQKP